MKRRRRKPSSASAMAKPLLAAILLALMWVGVQFDVHNTIGRALVAPLAPK